MKTEKQVAEKAEFSWEGKKRASGVRGTREWRERTCRSWLPRAGPGPSAESPFVVFAARDVGITSSARHEICAGGNIEDAARIRLLEYG